MKDGQVINNQLWFTRIMWTQTKSAILREKHATKVEIVDRIRIFVPTFESNHFCFDVEKWQTQSIWTLSIKSTIFKDCLKKVNNENRLKKMNAYVDRLKVKESVLERICLRKSSSCWKTKKVSFVNSLKLVNLLLNVDLYESVNSKYDQQLKLMLRVYHLLKSNYKNLLIAEQENLKAKYQHVVEFFAEKEKNLDDEQKRILTYMKANFSSEEFNLIDEFVQKSQLKIENDVQSFKQTVSIYLVYF